MVEAVEKKVAKYWSFFYRGTQVVLWVYYKIAFKFKAYGTKNFPKDSRGVILAPNHASYLDPPLLGISLKPPITYLAKDYLFKPFFLGLALRWIGCIPIKTEADDFRSIRQLVRELKSGKNILIFPEGTRSDNGEIKEPEMGVGFLALKSGAHVLPVYIRGTYKAFPKGAKHFTYSPVSLYFGKAFIPAHDPELTGDKEPYLAVSRKIMAEIKKLKEAAEQKDL